MRSCSWYLAVALGVGSLADPGPTLAQIQPPPSIRGIVVDSAGRPLEGVEVELVGGRRRQLTQADGGYRFPDLSAARYWLMARRIGYYPVQLSLTLRRGEAREIRVTMAAHPVELPEIVVRTQESNYRARMREFIWRSRSSFGGRFLTADDIARTSGDELAYLVIRYLPFKNISALYQPGGWTEVASGGWPGGLLGRDDDRFSVSRFAGRARYRPDCPPAVALNGGPISAGWAVNDFDPDEVEALEIYREGTNLPVEYDFGDRASCGLVVVWLKNYARPARP